MYDPVHLRSFLAVAQTLSFTQAARRLGLRQSTVSQHVRKLEVATGRQLFARDTHSVELSEDGEAMLGFARTIIDANKRAAAWFAAAPLRGRLRFGASEDFVLTRLPEILEEFRRGNPEVDLELTVGLSGVLHRRLAAGRLDLILGKRLPQETHGQLVWRDRLVWVCSERTRVIPDKPVPLIAHPPPSITRARALEALERHGRDWHLACTSSGLSGLRAAALAGLGVMAHAQSLIPPGLVALPGGTGLPDLGDVEFVLVDAARQRPAAQDAARALSAAILASGDRLQRPS
jgi:DNA-binding transcriptional LysR family regulator